MSRQILKGKRGLVAHKAGTEIEIWNHGCLESLSCPSTIRRPYQPLFEISSDTFWKQVAKYFPKKPQKCHKLFLLYIKSSFKNFHYNSVKCRYKWKISFIFDKTFLLENIHMTQFGLLKSKVNTSHFKYELKGQPEYNSNSHIFFFQIKKKLPGKFEAPTTWKIIGAKAPITPVITEPLEK